MVSSSRLFRLRLTLLTRRGKLPLPRDTSINLLSRLAIGIMPLDQTYYQPTTPPGLRLEELIGAGHSRNASDSSAYSNDSSPWSIVTAATSPGASPPRYHHGPTLLPKIRPQDVVIEPAATGGPQRHRRVLSNTRNPPGFVPYPTSRPARRSVVEPMDPFPLVSPTAISPTYGPSNESNLSSPVRITAAPKRKAPGEHARRGSGSSPDEAAMNRHGLPAYGKRAKYVSQPQPSPTTPVTPNIIVYPSCPQASPIDPPQCSPVQVRTPASLTAAYGTGSRVSSAQPSPIGIVDHTEDMISPSTTLLSYLTSPTQAINLVRNVSVIPTRGLHDYFWWDIRNLRSWTSFSLPTFNSINSLTKLLKTEISADLTPSAVMPSSRLSPEAEPALINLVHDVYAPRVNAALAVSQGPEHLSLYLAPSLRMTGHKHYGGPHLLANYASDTECTSTGVPRGRVVGVIKSFDRWNSGMRNEAPHRQVEYLNGLAHLQRCMREHSCRYGFIMTEIELVCVRCGCDDGDDVPYFGFLEVSAPIPTKTSFCPSSSSSFAQLGDQYYSSYLQSPATSDFSARSESPGLSSGYDALNVPMTASLALYFLLMLSKSVPLPSQPSGHLNVGGPGAMTRQRVLPVGKDKWIPAPQIGEKRDAKRVRGWVWPEDAWHRREGGGVPRTRGSGGALLQPRAKKWHK